MKKILAVLMAVLVLFSTCAVSVFATEAEPDTSTEVTEESDLVFPENLTQLKLSVVFKAFEKFFSFIINLFGDYADDVDNFFTDIVKDIFGTGEAADAVA